MSDPKLPDDDTPTQYKGAPFGVGFGCSPQPLRKGTPSMDSKKYIGMDVHKESISIAVMNGAGKIVMECVIETKASMILQFIHGLRGHLHVTFEEGTWAAWLFTTFTCRSNRVTNSRLPSPDKRDHRNVARISAVQKATFRGG